MSAARRSLLTATAAGTLLGALWFVPSAHATQEDPVQRGSAPTTMTARNSLRVQTSTESEDKQSVDTQSGDTASASTESGTADSASTESGTTASGSNDAQTRLADTGSIDTTPYVVGGTLFLGLGAGFVTYSVRRERTAAF
ncbi:LPXTG cell wall anchor domain-containing protein [Streptomyces sp. NBC_01136]|uniref:LPXTG cell wall anchor domain-containing protein n=1 Tax=Streptomyces sp. NBC_01136 TaxID=2903754 RepID=UPI003863BD8B|nr:LPXTG cell wall anchor domain-containing protein [Streptomyces sp. NBC_01136]